VPITTDVVCSTPAQGKEYNIDYVIKFVIDLCAGRWFYPSPSVSSTNKTDRHDIAEILLKVALKTKTPTNQLYNTFFCTHWNINFFTGHTLYLCNRLDTIIKMKQVEDNESFVTIATQAVQAHEKLHLYLKRNRLQKGPKDGNYLLEISCFSKLSSSVTNLRLIMIASSPVGQFI